MYLAQELNAVSNRLSHIEGELTVANQDKRDLRRFIENLQHDVRELRHENNRMHDQLSAVATCITDYFEHKTDEEAEEMFNLINDAETETGLPLADLFINDLQTEPMDDEDIFIMDQWLDEAM